MPNGTVKFFNVQKGFGFITPDDGSKDVFVPATSIAASGIAGLKPGLRVAFETQPDGKGPKAVELKQIAAVRPTQIDKHNPRPDEAQASRSGLTVYLDPASEVASDAVAELRDAGFEPRLVDYISNPPPAAELKALSLRLRDGDQSLVRRFDPLFSELRLDDRFISDADYWAAIHEHPSLINGPVLATATKARVCRTESAVEAFVAAITTGETAAVSRPKGLPQSLLRLLAGDAVPPTPAMPGPGGEKPAAPPAPEKRKAETREKADVKLKPKGEPANIAKANVPVKPASKAEAKPKRKAAATPKKPARQGEKKPIKKARGPKK